MSSDDNHDIQTDGQDDAIPLVPFQVTNFLAESRRLSELAAQISARMEDSSWDNRFPDNTLARAWYHNHPEDLRDEVRFSDKVGG